MKMLAQRVSLAGLLAAVLASGCTASHYRKSADKDAYRAIRQKAPAVKNMDSNFTIEQPNAISLDGFPVSTNVQDYLGSDGERERGARVLRLEDALDLAVHHSRVYQSSKERLYLAALGLTLTRHQFTPIFSAEAAAQYSVANIEQIVTDTNGVVLSDKFVEERDVSGGGSIRADWLIRDIGRIGAAFSADFTRLITGDRSVSTSSRLVGTFARPLLRDAGFKRETESLIQAERGLLYELRDFTQFRKEFSVRVARSYYGVLGSRDTVRNSHLRFQRSRKNAERGRAMVAEGRDTTANLGRLEQEELSSESSWINSIRSYSQSLDDFKILLGLSVDAKIVLDDRELEELQIRHPDLSVEDSIRVAFAARLDYLNSRDRLEDTERAVKLAVDSLRPQLDLTASAAIVHDPAKDNRGLAVPDPQRYNWNAGLVVDPGLDRKGERNAYRRAIISRNSAVRDLELQEDQIKLDVRNSWRTLDQAKRNYEISEISVKLAERRVEEQDLLAEFGRAKAQDQVDAQNDLISSRNQRTLALVTHTIARLEFWNNMGILYIKDNGQWEEVKDENAK